MQPGVAVVAALELVAEFAAAAVAAAGAVVAAFAVASGVLGSAGAVADVSHAAVAGGDTVGVSGTAVGPIVIGRNAGGVLAVASALVAAAAAAAAAVSATSSSAATTATPGCNAALQPPEDLWASRAHFGAATPANAAAAAANAAEGQTTTTATAALCDTAGTDTSISKPTCCPPRRFLATPAPVPGRTSRASRVFRKASHAGTTLGATLGLSTEPTCTHQRPPENCPRAKQIDPVTWTALIQSAPNADNGLLEPLCSWLPAWTVPSWPATADAWHTSRGSV